MGVCVASERVGVSGDWKGMRGLGGSNQERGVGQQGLVGQRGLGVECGGECGPKGGMRGWSHVQGGRDWSLEGECVGSGA